jgi:hypothetical protein
VARPAARLLVSLGVRHLTLIDEARIEPHHFGEMTGVAGPNGQVGRAKGHALAESLRALTGLSPTVIPVAASITRLRAQRAGSLTGRQRRRSALPGCREPCRAQPASSGRPGRLSNAAKGSKTTTYALPTDSLPPATCLAPRQR